MKTAEHKQRHHKIVVSFSFCCHYFDFITVISAEIHEWDFLQSAGTNVLFNHNADLFLLTLSRLSEREKQFKVYLQTQSELCTKTGSRGFRDPREGGTLDHRSTHRAPLRPRCQTLTLGNPGKRNQDEVTATLACGLQASGDERL